MTKDCRKFVTTSQEASQMFGVTTTAVTQAIQRGRIPTRMSGRIHLILLSDLVEYFGRQPEYIPDTLLDSFPLDGE